MRKIQNLHLFAPATYMSLFKIETNTLRSIGRFVPFALLLIGICLTASIEAGCKKEEAPVLGEFYCVAVKIGDKTLNLNNAILNQEVEPEAPLMLNMNLPVDPASVATGIQLEDANLAAVPFSATLADNNKTIAVAPTGGLAYQQSYTLKVTNGLKSADKRMCTPQTTGFKTRAGNLRVDSIVVNSVKLQATPATRDVDRNFTARVYFNHALNPATVSTNNVKLFRPSAFAGIQLAFEQNNAVLVITADQPLRHYEKYTINLAASIGGTDGFAMTDFSRVFYTALDPTPKFPLISDEALMDLVQQQTFKYFWDFGHPVSGLSRERNASGDIVTSGGSGFGVMSIIVGIERGFITRSEGVARWKKIVSFLKNTAKRYHGAWPHWLNGSNGATVPFSTKDNGADLVETSYLIQGLLTVRQYLNPLDTEEVQIINDIQTLWEEVEWDWFTRGGQNVLYWHWSPNYNWEMNHQIKGYNECLITYFLAASSPTHPISANVYHQGWASNGQIKNNKSFFGYTLPLGYDYGGPLFFAHYSFLGLDPRQLKDSYAEYWTQNTNHTLINRAYCVANPLKKVGYSAQCWGLTASDNHVGYNAHSPTNDLGVITPTAALSSFPYTPVESMEAMKFFYYQLGDKLWGQYGFYDAFNVTEGWYGTTTLAIDQGPIVVMLENHRTGKLWDLFMGAPEVATGAALLGFTF
jgi:hypothetical protein